MGGSEIFGPLGLIFWKVKGGGGGGVGQAARPPGPSLDMLLVIRQQTISVHQDIVE